MGDLFKKDSSYTMIAFKAFVIDHSVVAFIGAPPFGNFVGGGGKMEWEWRFVAPAEEAAATVKCELSSSIFIIFGPQR